MQHTTQMKYELIWYVCVCVLFAVCFGFEFKWSTYSAIAIVLVVMTAHTKPFIQLHQLNDIWSLKLLLKWDALLAVIGLGRLANRGSVLFNHIFNERSLVFMKTHWSIDSTHAAVFVIAVIVVFPIAVDVIIVSFRAVLCRLCYWCARTCCLNCHELESFFLLHFKLNNKTCNWALIKIIA